MNQIVFATKNLGKLKELQAALSRTNIKIIGLHELNCQTLVEETGKTFQENALLKARYLYQQLQVPVLADDSGLIIDALPNILGVHSARFMEHESYQKKNETILNMMLNKNNRSARFVCALAYIDSNGNEYVYEGIMEGEIANKAIGTKGFGYDPIFYYPPFENTLASVDEHKKNMVSHRGKAIAKFIKDFTHEKKINLVLYEPEIPQNTGNIIRTCMATNTALHLIEPLGFSMDEKQIKRCSMDYIKEAEIYRYKNWEDFVQKNTPGDFFFMTRHGKKAPSQIQFTNCKNDIYLILGKESAGLPKSILAEYEENCMRLPMVPNARSLNLSNCAAVVVYEVLRQFDYQSLSEVEVLKGTNWIHLKEV